MLELVDLTHRYGHVVALDHLTFTVPTASMFGFVGPNGAGKTTAMRAVLGLLQPDAGALRWHGGPIDEACRRRFGYLPEERGLYPKMRVRDQLVYLARLHGLAAADAAAAAERWLGRLGLAERSGDRLEALSLGNQQRVQLAAALVHDPVLLVLDEPFSGLDPIGVDVLAEVLLEQVAAGVPVVFSSHQLDLVERLCDRVAIVREGALVAEGRVAELRDRHGGRRLRVVVEGAPNGWADAVPGVLAASDAGAYTSLDLAADADSQLVLDAARLAGRVVEFAAHRPTLAELFREAVA